MWAGVDVGGRRKGLHAALVDRSRVVAGPVPVGSADAAVEWLSGYSPRVVAVDSPRSPAPDGSRSRECERALARAVCGIRYTPDRSLVESNPYYEWILCGLELYAALESTPLHVIECFPTASFTCWAGPRGSRTRAAWSREVLISSGLGGLPKRLNQDERDAIAAALTARDYDDGNADCFGDIVVPLSPAA